MTAYNNVNGQSLSRMTGIPAGGIDDMESGRQRQRAVQNKLINCIKNG